MFTHQAENSRTNYHYNSFIYTNTEWKPHFHRSFELITVLEGRLTLQINDRSFLVPCGSFALVLPNQIHSFAVDQTSLVWVGVFSEDFVPNFAHTVKGRQGQDAVFSLPEDSSSFYYRKMIESQPSTLLRQACLYAACDAYLQQIPLEDRRAGNDHLIGDVLDYVAEHFTEAITLQRIARDLGYEYHYLSRILNQRYRISFRSLVNDHRTALACRLLEEKELSVTEIALRCGFQSIRTFNEVFLEKTGATPSAFRKGIWKNNCFPGLIVKKM